MSTDRSITTSGTAGEQYLLGVRRLLAGDPAAAACAFRTAVEMDADFALGYAGLAVAVSELDADRPGEHDALTTILRARQCTRRISRRERQHVSIVELVLQGRLPRASALAREHLAEFPDDAIVLHVLTHRCHDLDDLLR